MFSSVAVKLSLLLGSRCSFLSRHRVSDVPEMILWLRCSNNTLENVLPVVSPEPPSLNTTKSFALKRHGLAQNRYFGRHKNHKKFLLVSFLSAFAETLTIRIIYWRLGCDLPLECTIKT